MADCPWKSPGQNTGVGSLSLLQGIFPTQGSNSGLLHCRWMLYQLSHKGSPEPRIIPLKIYSEELGPEGKFVSVGPKLSYPLSLFGHC